MFNTFDIGEGSDVLVVAGCGIHNPGSETARHDGVHEIIVRKGARMRYFEKHVGQGEGTGDRVLNPRTVITLEKGAIAELELTQIRGVDSARRVTEATLHEGAKLVVTERLLTHGSQESDSTITVALVAAEAAADLKSRSVARDESRQSFVFRIAAAAPARGHIECNTIIMDRARVRSVPEISAEDPGAEITHEAAIGRIAADQLIKLQSLGLSESEAVDIVLRGFLGTRPA